MAEDHNVSDLLRSLDIQFGLNDGDMITDAIVLARVVNPNKEQSAFYFGSNPGIDVITRLGLLSAGVSLMGSPDWESTNEE